MKPSSKFSVRTSSDHFKFLFLSVSLALILGLAVVSSTWGTSAVRLQEVLAILRGDAVPENLRAIFLYVRLPRILAALIVGAALSVSGLLLQAVLGNILASPSTLGLNSGAGFAVVLSAAIMPFSLPAKLVAAFFGSILTALFVTLLASRTGETRHTIILAGVAISSLLSAGTEILVTIEPTLLMDRQMFSIGGLANVQGGTVLFFGIISALFLFGSLFLSPSLNVLLLGEELATSLGLPIRVVRLVSILLSAVLAACAVSIGGLISFVGLLVPHAMRSLFGNDYRWLLPGSMILGAGFMLLCDTVARIAFLPFDIPVGILLSLCGAPFFLFLILKRRRRLS